ncbi:MAG: 7-carboxy-7-deazaguanine synthase [Rhodospirillaceae bacterium]
MSYTVKELYRTLQGEGARTGRVAVFCRFSGCNLWSGREEDRATSACNFCDTDFVGTDGVGGDRFTDQAALISAIEAAWGLSRQHRYVVFTGGEPLLQLDSALIEACHRQGFEIAVETNGTIAPPPGIDWLTVSPKAGSPKAATRWVLRSGDELKLVLPQPGLDACTLEDLAFAHFFVQPMAGRTKAATAANLASAVAWCLAHPRWRLSLQTHKLIGLP